MTDDATLTRLATLWEQKLGWVFEPKGGVFLNTGAEGHDALVFALVPSKILAFGKEPYTQTRYVP
jgi:hypothetical protein